MLRKMKAQKGFTLIELLIVIAIIGILAAIAIPMYKTQTIKAKMTEVTNAMSTIASAIGAHYQEQRGYPALCADITALNNSLGVGIKAVASGGRADMATDAAGVITGTIRNVDTTVDALTLTLTPSTDGATQAVTWAWAGSVGAAYIPKR